MELSINAMHFLRREAGSEPRMLFECFDLLCEAGFSVVDLSARGSLDHTAIREYLEKKGMRVNQTHCPYNRYDKKDYKEFSKTIAEAVESTHKLGAPIMVVHGDEFDFQNLEYTPEKALEFNYQLFLPAVEFAAKHNMKIAFETVFEDGCEGKPRFGSRVEDLIAICDKFGNESVGICWDIGHAKVQYKSKHPRALKKAGNRVIATHIHDNFHGDDLHLFPFLGDTDWKKSMETFREIGYNGEFTFEFVYDCIPDALLLDYLKLIKKTGDYLINT